MNGEVLTLIPTPSAYQQSATEWGTPSPAGHEEGAGAPVLPQEDSGVLQLTRLLSKLSQLLAVPTSEIPLPSQDNFWDGKDCPFPQVQTSLNFPRMSKQENFNILPQYLQKTWCRLLVKAHETHSEMSSDFGSK